MIYYAMLTTTTHMLGACFAYEEAFPRSPLCVIRMMVPLENTRHLVEAVKVHELKETNSYVCVLNCCILLRKHDLLNVEKGR